MKKAKAKSAAPKAAAKKSAAKSVAKTATPKPSLINAPAIRELAEVLAKTGLSEIEYESGGLRLRVARGGVAYASAPAFAPAAAAPAPAAEAPKAADPATHPGTVKSPMVGVLYLAPEPGAAAFISVGDTVKEGQTLALIEAMKTFNPVKAPRGGKVVKILLESGSPVEYGEPLVIIE